MLMAHHETTIKDHSSLKKFRNTKCTTCGKKFIINDTIHTTTLNKTQKDTIKNVGTLNIIRCNVVDWFVKVHIKK